MADRVLDCPNLPAPGTWREHEAHIWSRGHSNGCLKFRCGSEAKMNLHTVGRRSTQKAGR